MGWIVGDALNYLNNMSAGETFDLLIFDFPDPFESEVLERLYSEPFYSLAKSRMHERSLLVTQSGPCRMSAKEGTCDVAEDMTIMNLAHVFKHVGLLQHPMATWKPEKDMASEWSSVSYASNSLGSVDGDDMRSAMVEA